MAVLIALSAISSFAAGAIAGILGVLSVAIRREDRNLSLTSEATDHVTRAGRWLNGVGVRVPHGSAAAIGGDKACLARQQAESRNDSDQTRPARA